MVRIRLRRVGSKGQPSYRIVITDGGSPRDGRFIEKIGFYNPRTQPATMQVDEPRALYWLSKGAQPSDPVRRILDKLGTMDRYQRLRKGEAMDALLAEAQQMGQPQVDPRTRRDDIKPKAKAPKAAKAAEEAPAAVAESAPVEVAEATPVEAAETAPVEAVEAPPDDVAEAPVPEEESSEAGDN